MELEIADPSSLPGVNVSALSLRILAHVDHRFWKRLITHSGLS
jgi:hypothetical protein